MMVQADNRKNIRKILKFAKYRKDRLLKVGTDSRIFANCPI